MILQGRSGVTGGTSELVVQPRRLCPTTAKVVVVGVELMKVKKLFD